MSVLMVPTTHAHPCTGMTARLSHLLWPGLQQWQRLCGVGSRRREVRLQRRQLGEHAVAVPLIRCERRGHALSQRLHLRPSLRAWAGKRRGRVFDGTFWCVRHVSRCACAVSLTCVFGCGKMAQRLKSMRAVEGAPVKPCKPCIGPQQFCRQLPRPCSPRRHVQHRLVVGLVLFGDLAVLLHLLLVLCQPLGLAAVRAAL